MTDETSPSNKKDPVVEAKSTTEATTDPTSSTPSSAVESAEGRTPTFNSDPTPSWSQRLHRLVAVIVSFCVVAWAQIVVWGKAVFAWNLLVAHTIWVWTRRVTVAAWRGAVRAAKWLWAQLQKGFRNLPSWETVWRFVTGCLVAVRNGARRSWCWIAAGVLVAFVATRAFFREKSAALKERLRVRAAEQEEQRAARAEATRARVAELAEKAQRDATEKADVAAAGVETARGVEASMAVRSSDAKASDAEASATPKTPARATAATTSELLSTSTATLTAEQGGDVPWRFESGIDLATRIWCTVFVILAAAVMEWFGVMNPVRGQFREAPKWGWWYFGITISVLVPTIWAVRAGAKHNGVEVVAWALVLGIVAGLSLGVNSWVNGRWPV